MIAARSLPRSKPAKPGFAAQCNAAQRALHGIVGEADGLSMNKPRSRITGQSSRFAWSKLFGYDFFISFKLGRFPLGTQNYASDIARSLYEQDYTVFFSEEEAPPGEELNSTLMKALHGSRILVVILDEGALLQSKWVRREVEEFRRRHPKRPIVAINIDRALEKHGAHTTAWLGLEGRIWLDEANEAVKNGSASPEVLKRLAITPNFVRANTRTRIGLVAVSVVAVGAIGAAWFGFDRARVAQEQTQIAQTNATEADKQKTSAEKQTATALTNETISLTARSRLALERGQVVDSVQLALAAWPRNGDDKRLQMMRVIDVLSSALLQHREHLRLKGHGDDVNSAAFSPDGARVVTASLDETTRVWDVKTGAVLVEFKVGGGWVYSAAFSPDGARVITASSDKSARIFDAATGAAIAELKGHSHYVNSARFSPDGASIVTASADGTALVWDTSTLEKGEAFAVSCVRLGNNIDLIDLTKRYGLTELKPICGDHTPAPVDWSKVVE